MRFISSPTSSYRRPIKRLIEYTVFSGFVTAWRFATCPTNRSPPFVIATTDGVVRAPSWLGITTGSPPCNTETTELVVPRSIPIILLIPTYPPKSKSQRPPPISQTLLSEHAVPVEKTVRPKVNIQVECPFVKFSYNNCNCIFNQSITAIPTVQPRASEFDAPQPAPSISRICERRLWCSL